ncbi:MAG: ribulokinase [Ilumatobacteraceae bacterium]
MPEPSSEHYVIGIDFGTLTARAVVVRVADGAEIGSAVHAYRHAVIDRQLPISGEPLPPDWALQDPHDYVESMGEAVRGAIADAGIDVGQVIGLGTDFTACTMVPALTDGTPLSELGEFKDRPHAYAKLWKHHAAQPEADRINELAARRGEPWLARYGGLISSEWEYAKGLELLGDAPDIYRAMDRWVEGADWIVWQLCGEYVRNACSAGYKGILQDGQYPSREFLGELDPEFADFVSTKLDQPIGQLGGRAGSLTTEMAGQLGLPAGIAVAVGNVDAHVTAPAARAVAPGQMVAIMGTSTCHVMNGTELREVPGMCGVVDGGIIEGLWGYEAGQSGVGDLFGWVVDNCVPDRYAAEAQRRGIGVHEYLTQLAAAQRVGQHGLLALDWLNGNRSVLVNHELSGLIVGLTVTTAPEDIYRTLMESTAFGARKIVEAFVDSGVPVDELVVAGGLAKNALLMQIYADVLRLPLSLIGSEQGPALGSAIHAAVAAGAYPDVPAASEAMGKLQKAVYTPIAENADRYDELFAEYTTLHDYFGRGHNDVMRRLKRIRREVAAGGAS